MDFHEVLLNSKAQSGPFDGGCLICAKAILSAIGHGELIRVVSKKNDVEHYGALIDGVIYDMSGSFDSRDSWINYLRDHLLLDKVIWTDIGLVGSEIPDDADCVVHIAASINEIMNIRNKVKSRKY